MAEKLTPNGLVVGLILEDDEKKEEESKPESQPKPKRSRKTSVVKEEK